MVYGDLTFANGRPLLRSCIEERGQFKNSETEMVPEAKDFQLQNCKDKLVYADIFE